jgi:hypothetical protein
VNIANGSKKPNLVFRLPFLLEKKNDASGKHNLFPDYRSYFHEDCIWNNLLIPVRMVG